MLKENEYIKIFNFVNNKRNVLIAGHRNPDGDSISAIIALKIYLDNNSIKNTIVSFDDIPREYRSLPHSDAFIRGNDIRNDNDFDSIVLFECDSFERSGLAQYKSLPSLNMDHHISGKEFASVNIIDPEASSVCEMLFFAFHIIDYKLCDDTAKALFTGIASDTGFFRFSNTSSDTFFAAMKLMKCNIKINRCYTEIYENYSLERLRLIGHILYTSKYFEEIKTLIAVLNKEYIDTYNIQKSDLEGIINFMLISKDLDIAVLIKEFVMDECFVSLRSKENVDVRIIAQLFNGGGHKQAAGYFLKKTPEAVERLLIKAIKRKK